MQNDRRNQKEVIIEREYQNDLFGNPPSRWERYQIARKRFRNESPKEVFFDTELYSKNYTMATKSDNNGYRTWGSTLRKEGTSSFGSGDVFIKDEGTLRRYTPIECERLMSWPDDWTKLGIDDKGNKVEISDSQRYKMCGNGVVSAVVEELIKAML